MAGFLQQSSPLTSSLAEVIARARTPQMAPPASHPAVIPGPTGGGGTETKTQVKAQIDAEPIMRLFGWKTEEEKRQIALDMMNHLDGQPDDIRDKMMTQEPTQKILKGMFDAGYY